MLPCHPRQIDLWLVFFDAIRDPRLLQEYRSLLSGEELARQQRFYFEKDRRRYLVTRALVRSVLSRYAPIAPADWVFSANAYGRPQIANDHGAAGRISFNLSHTDSLIVLAIGAEHALGVDTENVRVRRACLDVADRFFSPEEVQALSALPHESKHDRFFDYWTLKESYIKARGMGLSIPLNQFSFSFPSDRAVAISIQSELNDDASRWRFWQFRAAEEYLVALCAERTPSAAPEIRLKKIVPLESEDAFDSVPFRTSG